jgi:hypothetical protein
VSRPAAGQIHDDAVAACQDSLRRSRARRAVAARLRTRRRRTRGGAGGFVAALTVLALSAPLTLAYSTTTAHSARLLTAGTTGADVVAVQKALGVTASGSYDSVTQRAVRAFQRSHGLAVDGVVGPQTRAALGLAPARAASTGGSASTGDSAPGSSSSAPSATLARIAQCESGGDPQAVSPDGQYRGKYQFSRATWRELGGSGDPAAAPEAEQDRMAALLLSRQGTSPWPSCG